MRCLKTQLQAQALMQDVHTWAIETNDSQIILNMRLLLFFFPALERRMCCASACVAQSTLMLMMFTLFSVCLHRRTKSDFIVTFKKM